MAPSNSNFDPYHKWLGIPPSEQPADYYRLLGLVKFEDDPDVIAIAADQRMAFVQKMAIGQHLEHSQKLLNELARARLVLVDPQKKEVYDASLIQVSDQSANPSRRKVKKTVRPKESGVQQPLKTSKPIFESPTVSVPNIQNRLMQWGRSPSGISILLLLCLFATSWWVRAAVLNIEDDNSEELNEPALVSNDTTEQSSDPPEISTQSPQVQREKFPPDLKTNIDDSHSTKIADSLVSAKEMEAKREQPSISPTTPTVAPALETPIKNPWLDFAFLEKKLQDEGIDQLLTEIPQDSENPDVETVRHALRLSANALRRDKKQLWAQLHARTLRDRTTAIDQMLGNKPPTTSLVSRFPTMFQSGGQLIHFIRHNSNDQPIAISSDGQTILSCGTRSFKVWDTTTGQVVQTLNGVSYGAQLATITPDGRRIIWVEKALKTIKVWDARTSQVRQTRLEDSSRIESIAITPDGQSIVSGSSNRTVNVWDVATGLPRQTLKGHFSNIPSVAITPDGRTIVSGSYDHTIKVWNTTTGQVRQTLQGHSSRVQSVAITPDGRSIASGSYDRTIKVWNTTTGRVRQTLRGHTSIVRFVAITPDGQTIVSGSDDGTIKIWDTETGQVLKTLLGHTSNVRTVSITTDGKTIISDSEDGTIKVWDADTEQARQSLFEHSSNINLVAITPDGQTIVSWSDDDTINVWDTTTGQIRQTLQGHSSRVQSVAITPDGQTIVSGSHDGTIKVWDAESGQVRQTLKGHSRLVSSVAITPDGQTIVSGSFDGTIKVWDAETGQIRQTLEGHSGHASSLAITPDGRAIVSGSSDGTINIWDADNGLVRQTVERHPRPVKSISITPDGKTIFSQCYTDIKVWDAGTGQALQTFNSRHYNGHRYSEQSGAITSDGMTVVLARDDGTLGVWEVVTGNLLAEFDCDSTINSVDIAGSTIIANGHAGDVHVFDLFTPGQTAMNIEHSPHDSTQSVRGNEDSVDSLFEKEKESDRFLVPQLLVPEDVKIYNKGSFTVWTVPNNPKPGEGYSIVISVSLPDHLKRYRADDLSGFVIGTDGYRQPILGPEHRRRIVYLPVIDRHAQLTIEVPGAVARVQDTLEIRSTMLNEEQKLKIEF